MKKMRKNKQKRKSENIFKDNGITLIALVVTIIVLLILAGVSLKLVLGNNGIVNKAKEAKIETEKSQHNTETALNKLTDWIDEWFSEKVQADYGEVNTAIKRANELIRGQYTEQSWNSLKSAINKVVWNLDSSRQAEVDEMAQKITNEINGLQFVLDGETPKKDTYIITVDGVAMDETYAYNTKCTITAPKAPVGKKFAYWEVDGNIVSFKEEYTFFVINDISINSRFEPAEANVDKRAAAFLTNVYVTKVDDEKYNNSFYGHIVLPEGSHLVDAGLVWSPKEDVELVVDNPLVRITHVTKIATSYQFSVTIKDRPKNAILQGRIFALVRDSEGNEELIYSTKKRVSTPNN